MRFSLQRIDSHLQLVPTKTPESQREIRLPAVVASALAAHLERRAQEKAAQGEDWRESGRLFHTKMEVLQRQAYGFRNFQNYRLRVKIMCS